MNYTTNFNLNKPEGTDLYNHLTIDNPNMDIIDAAMQANKLASIGSATELVSGTIHAITRADQSQNIFKFKATGNFKAGDTVTVDGVNVNAFTPSGHQLADNAYIISANVVALLDGTSLWILACDVQSAADVPWDNSQTDLTATNVQGALVQIYANKVAMDIQSSGSVTIPLNGTYQIPTNFMNSHRIIFIHLRRYSVAGTCMIITAAINSGAYSNGLALPCTASLSYTIKIDANGLITLTGNGNGQLGDPVIDLIGLT